MRPLEITLAILIAGNLFLFFTSSRPRNRLVAAILPLALLLALLVHLWIEKYRWQMLPLYALGLTLLLFTVPTLKGGATGHPTIRRRLSLLGLVLLVVFTLPPVLLPVPSLSPPKGPYQVGTFSIPLVDTSRQELYSGRDEPRAIMVQFWYPASPEPGARPGPWIDHADIVGPAMAKYLGFPRFFLDHVALVHSNSYPDAPLDTSGAPYPVIFFSHGWSGLRVQSTFLMEALASQGYVVVAIDHTYGAQVVVFPDGRVAYNNPRALPLDDPAEILEPAADLLVDQWAGDISFVLGTLAVWNENDPSGRLTGQLDLSRIGVSGHSTGGGAAVEFCGRDPRCTAGLGLDAYLTPVSNMVLQQGLPQPFLFLFSELWPTEKNNRLFAKILPASPQAQEITLLGAAHYDFTDIPMLSPLAASLGLKGPISGPRALQITSDFAVDFFDKTLRGGPGTLLQSPSEAYPEMVFGALP